MGILCTYGVLDVYVEHRAAVISRMGLVCTLNNEEFVVVFFPSRSAYVLCTLVLMRCAKVFRRFACVILWF